MARKNRGIQDVPKATKDATSGKALVKALRKCVSPKGKRSLFLRDLSDAQLAEVYGRLRLGQSYRLISDVLQHEWGVFLDRNQRTIIDALHKFKHKAFGLLQTESRAETSALVPKEERDQTRRARENMLTELQKRGEKVDSIKMLRFALHRQAERVHMWEEMENNDKVPTARATADLRLLGDLAEKAVKLEMELGVRERQPNEIVISQNHRFEALISGLNDDGDCLIQAASKLIEGAEKDIITLEMSSDGTYQTRPRTNSEQISDLAFGVCGGIAIEPDKIGRDEEAGIDDPGAPPQVLPDD